MSHLPLSFHTKLHHIVYWPSHSDHAHQTTDLLWHQLTTISNSWEVCGSRVCQKPCITPYKLLHCTWKFPDFYKGWKQPNIGLWWNVIVPWHVASTCRYFYITRTSLWAYTIQVFRFWCCSYQWIIIMAPEPFWSVDKLIIFQIPKGPPQSLLVALTAATDRVSYLY